MCRRRSRAAIDTQNQPPAKHELMGEEQMKKQLSLAAALICFAATVTGQGFSGDSQNDLVKERIKQREARQEALVGATFWIYYDRRSKCLLIPEVLSTPNILDKSKYTSDKPTRVVIRRIVQADRYRFHEVSIGDGEGQIGYIWNLPILRDSPTDNDVATDCALFLPPDQVAQRLAERAAKDQAVLDSIAKDFADRATAAAELAAKPGARIGMTEQQVRAKTNWGDPEHVNRTITAGVVEEQWVYAGGYLYFRNGRLHSIQETGRSP